MWVRYWDEASTAAVLEFTVDESAKPSNAAPTVKEKKEKKKKGISFVGIASRMSLLTVRHIDVGQAPAEASALPVSDKPVTLSFKGGLSVNKPSTVGTSSKKPVPLSQAFSMDDAVEGEGDAGASETNATEDPKGLSRRWETAVCAVG